MRKFRHYVKNTVLEALASRTKFKDYYQRALEEIIAAGITPQQIAILKKYGLLASDNVTSYHEGRSGDARYQTLLQAIQHVKQTGEKAYYVEMNLQNLGGINAALGHTGANEIYAGITQIIKKHLEPIASETAFFRHGGDEFCAFLVDVAENAPIMALGQAQQEIAQLARKMNVHELPHPKHPNEPSYAGTGVHYGMADIRATDEQEPLRIFKEADRQLEENKRSIHVRRNPSV